MIIFLPVASATPAATTPGTPGVAMTGQDIVRLAYLRIGVVSPVDTMDPMLADVGLAELNMLLDQWNADKFCAFSSTFDPFTLTPALSPHTIGSSGTFVVVQRPVTIDGITLLDTADVRMDLTPRDRAWWRAQANPTLSSDRPTEYYYEPAWPNGSLYFWPVPSTAYQVEIQTRGLLAALTLTDRISAPPGYRAAIVDSLAERLVAPSHVPMPEGLPLSARRARLIIEQNNYAPAPALVTRDAGMPGGCGGGYDFRTG